MGFGRVNALNAVNAAIGVNSNYGQAEKSASFVKPTEEKANHLISSSMNIF
jgi:hypothetical protein